MGLERGQVYTVDGLCKSLTWHPTPQLATGVGLRRWFSHSIPKAKPPRFQGWLFVVVERLLRPYGQKGSLGV